MILVAEVTGGSILICGPCTFGKRPAPWPSVIRALSVLVNFCSGCLDDDSADLSRVDSPRASFCPGSLAVGCPFTGLPSFLSVSLGGRFKGKDPTVSSRELCENWVTGTPVVYIGKATSLRARLRQYRDFGNGKPVGHWGGRYIWQLADAAELLVAWKPTAGEPRTIEAEMIAAFVQQFGKRPFANLKD